MGSETTNKFKVGDKVKLIHFPVNNLVGSIGIIIEVRSGRYEFPYKIKLSGSYCPAVYESEIALTIKIGEQLLLFEL